MTQYTNTSCSDQKPKTRRKKILIWSRSCKQNINYQSLFLLIYFEEIF
jgi:hypothetical protein